jgi:hypothetical protein
MLSFFPSVPIFAPPRDGNSPPIFSVPSFSGGPGGNPFTQFPNEFHDFSGRDAPAEEDSPNAEAECAFHTSNRGEAFGNSVGLASEGAGGYVESANFAPPPISGNVETCKETKSVICGPNDCPYDTICDAVSFSRFSKSACTEVGARAPSRSPVLRGGASTIMLFISKRKHIVCWFLVRNVRFYELGRSRFFAGLHRDSEQSTDNH